VKPREILRI